VFVASEDRKRVLSIMRAHPLGTGAVVVGHVTAQTDGSVTLTSAIGATRIVDMLTGEQLPRIC
jgi:hydrogenase expression/formation protein HypE